MAFGVETEAPAVGHAGGTERPKNGRFSGVEGRGQPETIALARYASDEPITRLSRAASTTGPVIASSPLSRAIRSA